MENQNYEHLDTEKGGQMVKDANGYLYWKSKEKRNTNGETRAYWRCIYFQQGPNGEKETACKGFGSLYNNVFKVTTNHSHESYEDAVVLKEFEGRVRQMAKSNTDISARTIFERALDQQKDKTPNYVLGEIKDDDVERNIRRYKKNALEEPPIPESLERLIIQEPYLRHHNEIIVKFDGYDDENNRHLIVTTEELLNTLRDYVEWGADGTLFHVVRSLFHQVWIIFAKIGTSYVPCVFCFMSSRTQIAYKFLLTQIQRMRPTAIPTSIATDFEMAEMNAFQLVYPAIQHKACFFHFVKNLFKRVIDSGLSDRYKSEKASSTK